MTLSPTDQDAFRSRIQEAVYKIPVTTTEELSAVCSALESLARTHSMEGIPGDLKEKIGPISYLLEHPDEFAPPENIDEFKSFVVFQVSKVAGLISELSTERKAQYIDNQRTGAEQERGARETYHSAATGVRAPDVRRGNITWPYEETIPYHQLSELPEGAQLLILESPLAVEAYMKTKRWNLDQLIAETRSDYTLLGTYINIVMRCVADWEISYDTLMEDVELSREVLGRIVNSITLTSKVSPLAYPLDPTGEPLSEKSKLQLLNWALDNPIGQRVCRKISSSYAMSFIYLDKLWSMPESFKQYLFRNESTLIRFAWAGGIALDELKSQPPRFRDWILGFPNTISAYLKGGGRLDELRALDQKSRMACLQPFVASINPELCSQEQFDSFDPSFKVFVHEYAAELRTFPNRSAAFDALKTYNVEDLLFLINSFGICTDRHVTMLTCAYKYAKDDQFKPFLIEFKRTIDADPSKRTYLLDYFSDFYLLYRGGFSIKEVLELDPDTQEKIITRQDTFVTLKKFGFTLAQLIGEKPGFDTRISELASGMQNLADLMQVGVKWNQINRLDWDSQKKLLETFGLASLVKGGLSFESILGLKIDRQDELFEILNTYGYSIKALVDAGCTWAFLDGLAPDIKKSVLSNGITIATLIKTGLSLEVILQFDPAFKDFIFSYGINIAHLMKSEISITRFQFMTHEFRKWAAVNANLVISHYDQGITVNHWERLSEKARACCLRFPQMLDRLTKAKFFTPDQFVDFFNTCTDDGELLNIGYTRDVDEDGDDDGDWIQNPDLRLAKLIRDHSWVYKAQKKLFGYKKVQDFLNAFFRW